VGGMILFFREEDGDVKVVEAVLYIRVRWENE
jgi:hypothetical protein